MLVALLIAARLSTPQAPEARDGRLELSWEAPAGCPGSDDVRALVRRMSAGSSSDARARVRIETRGTGFSESLEITVEGVVERRELEADSCTELVRATALVIAIALDPIVTVEALDRGASEALREVPEAPSVPVPDATELERARVASPSVAATPSPGGSRAPEPRGAEPRWHVDADVKAGAGWGSVPGVAGIVGAALGAERAVADAPRLRLGLDGRYTIPSTATHPDRPALAARFDLWAVGPRACLVLGTRRWSVPACAGLELGLLRARATGTADARTDRSPWVAATVDAALRWRARGPWVVGTGLGVGIPLRRERFHFDEHVDPIRQLHAVAPLTVVAWLGIGLQRP